MAAPAPEQPVNKADIQPSIELGRVIAEQVVARLSHLGILPGYQGPDRPPTSASLATERPRLRTGRFRFDWATDNLLIDKDFRIAVPPEYAEVLREMTKKDPAGPGRTGYVTFLEAGALYAAARLRIRFRSSPKAIRDREMAKCKKQVQDDPVKFGHRWASNLYRWLRNQGIDSDGVLVSDSRNQLYRLGPVWDPKRPAINVGEVPLFYGCDPQKESADDHETATAD